MPELTFDEKEHSYTYDGIKLPSVTQVLKSCGFYDFSHVSTEDMEYKRLLGKAVHKATEIYDNFLEDKYDLDETLVNYVKQWQSAKRSVYGMMSGGVEKIEQPFYTILNNPLAGTPDRVCINHNKCYIVDIKTGQKTDTTGVQLAGYKMLLKPELGKLKYKCFGVYLKEHSFEIVEYDSPQYDIVFQSALNIYYWKNKKG